uniref:Forkhead box protein fkh-2 n=1 Tax=Trichuris muris TaxID=70415 RepID=A0A5S6Q1H5_TRIMR
MQTTDDALTNLSWLIQHQQPLAPIGPQSPPSSPPTVSKATVVKDHPDTVASASPSSVFDRSWAPTMPINYHMEPVKPPYSYAQLIAMAMQAHGNEKVLLTNIYSWIRENFAYFRTNDTTWQNSVRHNLSLNKQFIKVPRDPRDKGKGSYWMLDPRMKDSYCLRRRNFGDFSHRKTQQQDAIRPQINPAIKVFLESSNRPCNGAQSAVSDNTHRTWSQDADQYSSMEDAAAVAAICENFGDLNNQECLYNDQSYSGFFDFSEKLFKQDFLSQDADYCPLGAKLLEGEEDDINKAQTEYTWEPFRDFPDCNNSQRETFDAEGNDLPLRIPTPEWWDNVNSANSLLLSSCAGGLPSPHEEQSYNSLSPCPTNSLSLNCEMSSGGPCANSSSSAMHCCADLVDKQEDPMLQQWADGHFSEPDNMFLDMDIPTKTMNMSCSAVSRRTARPSINVQATDRSN